ncbi:MAG: acetate kinase [Spirochaetales bacterium]|uniref:Acetate kinase n=1 Tax=Candidatus Thalassospirochaeta sargassi TaxID=3119039 RepID=A0AAJ1MJ65_9SPIO|nr:acetate kinase [Spirochaetales bacterium]
MNVLVINSGSSSLKFQVIDMNTKQTLCKGLVERIGLDGILNYQPGNGEKRSQHLEIPDHNTALGYVLDTISCNIDAVGHRIVHGGAGVSAPLIINDKMLVEFEKYNSLAPLHNPACLLGVKAAQKFISDVPHVASFDTAYYTGMEDEDFLYALDYSLYEKYGYRKFGFHSASHKYVNLRAAAITGISPDKLHAISCHIGGGVTVAASIGCEGVDTSVGYGTVCGVPMGTRSGDVDPDVILNMIEEQGMSAKEVKEIIYKKSGLLGLSAVSSDIRDILNASSRGNKRAELALRIFSRSIRRFIGALAMSLQGRMDALIFTAGIGENSAIVRSMICRNLDVLGIKIDENLNNSCSGESIISAADSRVKVIVVPTNEELMIATQTIETIRS